VPALAALPILVLLIGFGALIFIELASRITEGLFQSSSGFASILTAPLRLIGAIGGSVVHHLVNAMTPAVQRPQQIMGAALHDDANLVRRLRAVLIAQALVVVGLAQAVRGHVSAADLKGIEAGLNARIGNAERQARGIGADVQPQIKGAVRGIEAGVNQRVGSLDKAIEQVRLRDIPAIRSRARVTENELSRLWQWVHKNIATVGTLTFAGAVAVALARLGGGWIRCKNWNRIGKRICGLPTSLIDSLLAGLIDVLLIADLCQLTKVMVGIADSSVVQSALSGLIDGIDDLIICQGVDRPPALAGYWTAPPPAQTFAALPT
jgi:hypothetical protein